MMDKIFLIVDLVLWISVILSIGLGFLRGQKKSIIHLVVTVGVVLIAVLLTGPIAAMFSKIKISGKSILALISEKTDVINLDEGTVASSYVGALITAVMRLPVYYVLLFINLVIIRPILKAIVKGIFRNRSRGDVEKDGKTRIQLLSRGIGAAISLPAFIIVFFVVTAPIFGFVGLAENISENKEQLIVNTEEPLVESNVETEAFEKLDEVLDSMNSKAFFAVYSKLSGKNHNAEVAVLSDLLKIKTDNGTLNIKKELDSLIPLASVALQATESSDVMEVVTDNRELITTALKGSDFINILMPLAVEIADYKVTDDSIDFTKLKEADWTKEKDNLIDILDSAISFLDSTDFSLEDPIAVLGSENLSTALKDLGAALQKSVVVHDILMVYANNYLHEVLVESLPDGLEAIADVIDLVRINLEKDMEILGKMANQIYQTGLVTDSSSFDIIASRSALKNIVLNAFSLSTINGNEEKLISSLITYTKFDEKLNELGVTLNYKNVDWSKEKECIANLLYDVLELVAECGYTNLDDIDMLSLVKENIDNPLVTKIVDNICESQLMHGSIVSLLNMVLQKANLQNWASDRFKALADGSAKEEPDEIKNEIHILLAIVSDALDVVSDGFEDIDFTSFTDEQFTSIENVLHKMNESNFLSIDELANVMNSMLESMDYETRTIGIQDTNKNGSTSDEWDTEITTIIAIAKQLKELPDLSDEGITENAATFGKLINSMKASLLFGNDLRNDGTTTVDDNVFNNLIFEILSTTGLITNSENPNGFIDEETARSADWSKYNYEVELPIICEYNSDEAPEDQGSATLDLLQKSQIINDFFNMEDIVKDAIGMNQTITIDGVDYNLLDYIEINNENLKDRSWGEEMDAVDSLKAAFDTDDATEFKTALENFVADANTKDSLAAEAAQKILDDLNK